MKSLSENEGLDQELESYMGNATKSSLLRLRSEFDSAKAQNLILVKTIEDLSFSLSESTKTITEYRTALHLTSEAQAIAEKKVSELEQKLRHEKQALEESQQEICALNDSLIQFTAQAASLQEAQIARDELATQLTIIEAELNTLKRQRESLINGLQRIREAARHA